MTLTKSLLLGTAATIVAVAGAQAADLPSRKAAPATYVKICDAYGAGFFYIPGTDTCVKLGGYVRAEYQYTPATNINSSTGALVSSLASTSATPKNLQDTTGYEIRGRIDVDARTPTGMGVARTFVRLRAANTSGIRNTSITNVAGYTMSSAATTGITIESAMVQWAGFTFGVAPENYAMMPSHFYNGNPWAGFPNGMKQIAYTANFGGGVSATLALEDRRDHGYGGNTVHNAAQGTNIVANMRLDQAWGFAAIHGLVGNNSYYTNASGQAINGAADFSALASSTTAVDTKTKSAYAIGATVNVKLPMIAPGDQLWLTANYVDGALGMLLSDGGLSNVNTAQNKRMLGGLVRVDSNIVATNGLSAAVDNVTGWNVAGAFTHYWTPQWRSNLNAGYIEINPPTQTQTTMLAWGKGQLQVYTGSLIYSPAKDLDIGLELQYANLKNHVQNASTATNTAFNTAGRPGLSESNWTSKLRVERTF